MRELLDDLVKWRASGQALALAAVVRTWGSAPRREGAKLLVCADGRLTGSVSGGCVEAAVIEAAHECLRGAPPRLLRFGVADEQAWSVGLACGGTIEVFVAVLDPCLADDLQAALREERSLAVVTLLEGRSCGAQICVRADGRPAFVHGEWPPETESAARAAARDALHARQPRRLELSGSDAFIDVLAPPPTLVIVGGVHVAVALVELAHVLGFRTLVIEPRAAFASPERFPRAEAVLDGWPDEALAGLDLNPTTAVAVLTHDPKLDDPALCAALPSRAFYVGALGSRATHERRRARLLAAGLSEEHLARLHAPIGLPLGGRSPEEIALSVMAQVVEQFHRAAAAPPPAQPGGSRS